MTAGSSTGASQPSLSEGDEAPPANLFAEPDRSPIWFVTPGVATLLFIGARLYLGFGSGLSASTAAGLAGEPPRGRTVARVVAQIRSADQQPRRRTHRVPRTEGELLRLLRRDGVVHFTKEEVDVLATPSREFSLEEGTVIRVRASADEPRPTSDELGRP